MRGERQVGGEVVIIADEASCLLSLCSTFSSHSMHIRLMQTTRTPSQSEAPFIAVGHRRAAAAMASR